MNIPRKSLFGKLDTSLFRAMESATALAKLRGNPYVELCHWLLQFWQLAGTDLQRLASRNNLDQTAIESELRRACEEQPVDPRGLIDFGDQVQVAIEKAWTQASLVHADRKIRSAWLLSALLGSPELRSALKSTSSTLLKIVLPVTDDDWAVALNGSIEQNDRAHDRTDLAEAIPGEASGAIASQSDQSGALAKYCTDLTEQARNGKIDPVIGREQEIRTMIDILLRRRQNNPLLTGEAGVGKTAVVEGLALAIASGDAPPALQAVHLMSLDVGALIAGASMRGEFESRLKQLLKEAQDCEQPVILFIDEIHTLVGAGGQAGTGDAANLLKPALARGNLRTIGATTWSEYKRHIEKDPALTRRFQVLQVLEPEEVKAITMVRGIADTFSRHHGVSILDEAIRAAVTLSHRYIPARQLPDKAISLLDTACARVAMSLHAPPALIEQLRYALNSLKREAALLTNEARIGYSDDKRIAELDRKIAEQQQQLSENEAQWQRAKETAAQILSVRGQIAALSDEPDSHAESNPDSLRHPSESPDALRARLGKLERELAQWQGENSRIHLQVDEAVVAAIVADWTGIPVGRMVRDEVRTVLDLKDRLARRVVGQDRALERIAERIKTARAKLSDPNKPLGTFLLVGPSGVGKTETALALAEAIYGGENNLITINMSEYQEAHTVSSLKGSPPGYVGYGEGGVLTEAVRRRPYSVILLDEIEKAHPDVHEVFYQVFDKGWMEDGEGRVIDFKNTLILLTSNTGSDLIDDLCADPLLTPEPEALAEALQPALRTVFPAAFLGRVEIVPYFPLAENILQSIVELQLDKIALRMEDQHSIRLTYTPELCAHVVSCCGTHETGARRIGHFIEQNILPTLADIWLQAMQDGQSIQSVILHDKAVDTEHSNQQSTSKAGVFFQVDFSSPLSSTRREFS